MPELPVLSADEFIAAMRRLGYEPVRQRGSHIRLRAPGRPPLSVPNHRELARGTLRRLIRDSGLEVEEFAALLES